MRQNSPKRNIRPIELQPSIVQEYHVNIDNKHLSSTSTLNVIRKKWTTDNMVGGIHRSHVEKYLCSCTTCDNFKLQIEAHNIHHHLLDITLDQICTKYIVLRKLRRNYKCKDQIVKYYHCHRNGTKNILIGRYILLDLLKKYVNQDRKFRLCSYYFQKKNGRNHQTR